jgi:hypothetical protein
MNVLGALVIGLGIASVVLGWYGAAHSPYLYQEIPYLISGGLLGVALVVTGAAAFSGSWALRQIQESRRDTQAVVAAIERLERLERSARLERSERSAGAVTGPPIASAAVPSANGEGATPGPHAGTAAR